MKRMITLGLLIGTSLMGAMGGTGDSPTDEPLTVHEWGTFTSIAGLGGQAVDWQPAGGPSDLPCFVDSIVGRVKLSLRGTIRMETPVIYFYGASGREIDVEVAFPEGVITEWYPRAEHTSKRIVWKGLRVSPELDGELPHEGEPSHYYAARATHALPVAVGNQQEKFLFYRGVGNFQPPLQARLGDRDTIVHLTNTSSEEIGGLILFDNRDGRIFWRPVERLGGGEDVALPAEPEKGWSRGMESLETGLVAGLVESGLYVEEALAMVETWKDSWFEQGTRLFYIVPEPFVDSILPLEMEPRPAALARVFVGRMEILTPRTLEEVTAALRADDLQALEPYGRFLEPILNQLAARAALDQGHQERAFDMLGVLTDRYATQARRCS